MQSIVNIIRGTGATNIIQLPGIDFADLMACNTGGGLNNPTSPSACGFLESGVQVSDPLATTNPTLGSQLAADVDLYPDNGQYCSTTSCFNTAYAPVIAAGMPLDGGEVGVIGSAPSTSSFPLLISFIDWMDSENESNYYAAAWDTWSDFISNYSGMPGNGVWGDWYYNHITGYTSVLPVNTVLPTISGTAQQGDTLTAAKGTWTAPTYENDPTAYTYQWQTCSGSCTNISGATNSTYTPQASDVGNTIKVVVSATDDAGTASATSTATATVTSCGSCNNGITPMPIISRNPTTGVTVPVYYPGGPTNGAVYNGSTCNTANPNATSPCSLNDGNYAEDPTGTYFGFLCPQNYPSSCYEAENLSSVSAVANGQLSEAYVQFDNGHQDDYDGAISDNGNSGEPFTYQIQVNCTSLSQTTYPTTGWVTKKSVTGINYGDASGLRAFSYLINMTDSGGPCGANYNWIQINDTQCPCGWAAMQGTLDIWNASAGNTDSWAFLGDSITELMAFDQSQTPDPVSGTDSSWGNTFSQQINAWNSTYTPAMFAGGYGGSTTPEWASWLISNTNILGGGNTWARRRGFRT